MLLALATAALLTLLAGIALAARPASWLNRGLAAFLLLRAGTTTSFALLRDTNDATFALALAHTTVWYALALPLSLLVVLDHVAAKRLPMQRATLAVAAGATLLLGALMLAQPTLFVPGVGPLPGADGHGMDTTPLVSILSTSVALLEAAVVLAGARAAAHATDALHARRSRALAIAFAIVPLQAGAFFLGAAATDAGRLLDVTFLTRSLGTLAAFGIVVIAMRTLAPRLDANTRRASLALMGVVFALGALEGASRNLPTLAALLPESGTTALLARSALAVLASLALVRFGLAGIGERGRAALGRATRIALSLSAAGLIGGIALVFLGAGTLGITLSLLLAGAALALSPLTLRELARSAAERLLLPQDDEIARAERSRRYAAALDAAHNADGTLRKDADAFLAALRADSGITEREHALALDAFRRARATPEAAPDKVGQYTLLRELGRGATGSVWLARDPSGRPVALKRMRGATDALGEARTMLNVRHPRVLRYHEAFRHGDETVLVLDYAPGGSARARLDRDGPLAPTDALRLTLDALDGLAALHAKGLVHRDIKPENILLDEKGRAMLGDLGSARVPDHRDVTLATEGAVGTLATMAPEVVRGATATPASDVHMMGATLYRLLTGAHHVALEDTDAFEARERILLDPPRLPHPRVPAELENVIRRALAKRPETRYQGTAEMRAALVQAGSTFLIDEQRAADAHDIAGV